MMSSPAGTDPDFNDVIPFYSDMEDVYPDAGYVSSGDAASLYGAGAPYGTASPAADVSSDDIVMLYEQLCNVNDNLAGLADLQKEGFLMVSICLGFISGILLVLCLWMGGRK